MRYMLVERFAQGARPVYERAEITGRLLPPGLHYVESWVAESLDKCFQLMETDDPRLLDDWMKQWSDLVVFEDVVAVTTSAEAASRSLATSS